MNLNIKIRNQDFVLHPSGATYWPEQEILLIADVHLGKISHFRKFGSAVPLEAINQNFSNLDQLLKEFDPEHLVFLGDLFHSSLNMEWDLFAQWYQTIDNQVHLIVGNHDIISPIKYKELGISIFSELKIGEFLLTHHPEEHDEFFNICGHIHPGYKFIGQARQLLKLPCFFLKPNQFILPAFGEFTGNYYLKPEETDRVYAVTGNEVILVN
ncbi:ligase-associated DNA damage response endonuclease PdeM [Christiangramia salexigens]|uniref:Metallophosphoesterase n=1 Tax=Christiangramia salexigens TaxID=1913577 RepID=A0A1L3J735_9FLAO|nr:ligase-associated DNA damage response endonuclease PdeM [Christiangramia salexigens]APG60921.1 metallophosphoesterase [Christiangramia salexigens]